MPKATDIPACPGVPAHRGDGRQTRQYTIQLVTPLFGGGVVPGEPDSSFPIRSTSIRGQLQFWWRATRGAGYATSQLLAPHADIWGTTEQRSKVDVEVSDVNVAVPRPCARYEWDQRARRGQGGWRLNWEPPFRNSALPYALFPFQGQPPPPQRDAEPEKMPAHFISHAITNGGNGSFTLRVRFDESLRQEVETAVWAWVNFGGLGARTRRGCGSLFCEELAPKTLDELKTWFQRGAGTTINPVRQWPTLPMKLLYHHAVVEPFEAWNQVIGNLKAFRQGVEIARDPGSPAGLSRYPEPDTIRRITDRNSSGHQPRPETERPDGFPRAEFGLPIVFHFKDERRGDPYDTSLYPFLPEMTSEGPRIDESGFPAGQTMDRMASPLILRPLALAPDRAVPIVLRLATTPLEQVELQHNKTRQCLTPRRAVPVRAPAFATGNSPINDRSTNGSALEAFLVFVQRDNGFQEVTR